MKNEDYLTNIYNEVKSLGFVNNQYDFSVMCGRTPAWFSAIKARGLPMTADACLTLSFNLSRKAIDATDRKTKKRALSLSQALVDGAQQKISERANRIVTLYMS
jgi:hypothetical protein